MGRKLSLHSYDECLNGFPQDERTLHSKGTIDYPMAFQRTQGGFFHLLTHPTLYLCFCIHAYDVCLHRDARFQPCTND